MSPLDFGAGSEVRNIHSGSFYLSPNLTEALYKIYHRVAICNTERMSDVNLMAVKKRIRCECHVISISFVASLCRFPVTPISVRWLVVYRCLSSAVRLYVHLNVCLSVYVFVLRAVSTA